MKFVHLGADEAIKFWTASRFFGKLPFGLKTGETSYYTHSAWAQRRARPLRMVTLSSLFAEKKAEIHDGWLSAANGSLDALPPHAKMAAAAHDDDRSGGSKGV